MSDRVVGRLVIWHPNEVAPITLTYTDIHLFQLHLQTVHEGKDWLYVRGGVMESHSFDERIKCSSITKYRSEIF